MAESRADLRRHPRVRVSWKVIVEVPGSRPRMRKTIDVSPFGMKVRFDAPLSDGADARLSLSTPDRRGFQVNAIVWRTDPDGPVFVFVGVAQEQFLRLKLLLDSYRGAA
jgi:hypothetical protein